MTHGLQGAETKADDRLYNPKQSRIRLYGRCIVIEDLLKISIYNSGCVVSWNSMVVCNLEYLAICNQGVNNCGVGRIQSNDRVHICKVQTYNQSLLLHR